MSKSKRAVAIVLLLSFALMSFSLRHFLVDTNTLENQSILVNSQEFRNDRSDIWHIERKGHSPSLIKSLELTILLQNIIIFVFTISVIAFNVIRMSHIEYCGKKMVRAIMIQWRPA